MSPAAPIPVVLAALIGRDGRVKPEPPIRRPTRLDPDVTVTIMLDTARYGGRRIGARSGLEAAIPTADD